MTLDPQVATYLRDMAIIDAAEPAPDLPLAQQRLQSQQRDIEQAGEPEAVAKITDHTIVGPASAIPLRIYTPEGSGPFPVLLYFHPGGWVFGSIEASDPVCRAIARHTPCIVVSVGYRLAPEHKFPAAPEDCYAATQWVADHAHEFNGDPQRIAVGGDSAGGNLAAVVTLMARDQHGPELCFQVIIYGETDYYEPGTPSYTTYAAGYGLTKAEMSWLWDQYIDRKEHATHPYASPLRATDLSKLPPVLIITAEYDTVRDEAELYAQRLQEAGVPVQLTRYQGMIHSFFRMFTIFDRSKVALKEITSALAAAFAT
ncbi:putative lipase/esterase [Dictyobacter alpinus]|uniref:Putative lipase/esterase n=1 Tax=Dictyobacter alpinus TaxID=2014873 RepID=A0A402BC63_9CHLR|nr:alpha/beta hydrolase [Dictyobacter alpinus]GCE28973.1 putative lipase/esterase [Dictyobacter alpinus]